MGRKWLAALGLLVLTAAAGGGYALAHDGDTSLIHGCVKKNGDLTVIGADEVCGENEESLDWNIQGEPGEKGDQGEPGQKGDPGAPGASDAEHQEVVGELSIEGLASGIDVLGFNIGVSQSGTTHTGGGAGAGKANFQDLSVTKFVDELTPTLAFETARGTHHPGVVLKLYRPGTTQVFMTYALKNVIISVVSDRASGRPGSSSLEDISFNFSRITWTSTPSDGGAPASHCFDVVQNASC